MPDHNPCAGGIEITYKDVVRPFNLKRIAVVSLVCAVIILLVVRFAYATDITFLIWSDFNQSCTNVVSSAPDGNFCTADDLYQLSNGDMVLNFSYICHSISDTVTINNVTVQLWSKEHQGAGTSGVYRITDPYAICTITYNNQPNNDSSNNLMTSQNPNPTTGGGWVNISISAADFQDQCQCAWGTGSNCSGYLFYNGDVDADYFRSGDQIISVPQRPMVHLSFTEGPTDTCTPPATGNYFVNAADNCEWTTNTNIPGNVTINGSGVVSLRAEWTFTGAGQYIYIMGGAEFAISSGGSVGG